LVSDLPKKSLLGAGGLLVAGGAAYLAIVGIVNKIADEKWNDPKFEKQKNLLEEALKKLGLNETNTKGSRQDCVKSVQKSARRYVPNMLPRDEEEYISGRSRQGTPVRMIQKIASSTRR